MNRIKFNFLKKECEIEMYNEIVKNLLEKGYTLKKSSISFLLDCKQTKKSNYPNTIISYPYIIKITY